VPETRVNVEDRLLWSGWSLLYNRYCRCWMVGWFAAPAGNRASELRTP